jgi:hypothetical protein
MRCSDDKKAGDMKTFRAFLICCLLTMATLGFTGCASIGHGDTASEAAQDQQWDDMTAAQKIGTCLWWPLQYGLLVGGSMLGHGSPQSN